MAHWLLKSEPAKYSWDQMVKDKRTHWDGVHNYQAALHMKASSLSRVTSIPDAAAAMSRSRIATHARPI